MFLFRIRIAAVILVLLVGGALQGDGDPSLTTATLKEMQTARDLGPDYVRITLRYPGVYRVTGRELQAAGVDLSAVDTARLGLWNNGIQIPVVLSAKPGAPFRPTDHIEFVADAPRGTFSYYRPYNLHNVYLLNWRTSRSLFYTPMCVPPTTDDAGDAVFMEHVHYEEDNYYRHSTLPPGTTDNFFWFFYSAGQPDTWMIRLEFPGYVSNLGIPVSLSFRVLGLTNVPSLKPTHKFAMRYGEYDLGGFGFDGISYHDFCTSLPAEHVKGGERILFATPPDRNSAVDTIALDSFDVAYPRNLDAGGRSLFRFNNSFVGANRPSVVRVHGLEPGTRVFSPADSIVFLPSPSDGKEVFVSISDDPTTYVAVSEQGIYTPDDVTLGRANSTVEAVTPQTRALVLYHPKVAEAAEYYGCYRRKQGIETACVNVNEIYDSLNHGFISDVALKRFIRYAADRAPGLHYLLLFGDSTYDYRECRNVDDENPATILIPIHWVTNPATMWTGGYPDDNWYGALVGFNRPDLAVGRIPANNDEEGFEYIRKVIEYEQLQKARDGKLLLISSVEASFQDLVHETRKMLADHFSTCTELFPEKDVATREIHRIQDEISSGVQVLYYVGHGGNFVWRVGPIDFKQQKDLFTPGDVEKLKHNGIYPIVNCSSCYTTSFDSLRGLGEAFVLQPRAGAIALIGTPWKSTVYEDHAFNRKFFEFYVDPTLDRLGDAFLMTKRAMGPTGAQQADTQTFTLLGDPMLKLVRR